MEFPPDKSGGLIEARGHIFRHRHGCVGFRRINPAASLKPVRPSRTVKTSSATFPPDKSGGLIEACSARPRSCFGSRFRRVNPAASLKHAAAWSCFGSRFRRVNPAASLKLNTYAVNDTKFPPGKSGGLIEARWASHQKPSRRCGFRRVNPAASLKLADRLTRLPGPCDVSAG